MKQFPWVIVCFMLILQLFDFYTEVVNNRLKFTSHSEILRNQEKVIEALTEMVGAINDQYDILGKISHKGDSSKFKYYFVIDDTGFGAFEYQLYYGPVRLMEAMYRIDNKLDSAEQGKIFRSLRKRVLEHKNK